MLRQFHPRAIVLDVVLRGEDTWNWLAELKADEATREIPILVLSAVEDRGKGLALGADSYCVKPLNEDELLEQLQRLTRNGAPDADKKAAQVIIIDDEPAARYVLSKFLGGVPCRVKEAENGREGLRMIKASLPQLVLLDLNMPDISGFELLNELKTDAATQSIPVAVVTSATLTEADRRLLGSKTCAVINKSELSRQRIEELWQRVFAGEERP
jgi:CheY-like chemotaxis protein